MDPDELAATFINKIPQIIPMRHFVFKSQWRSDEIRLQILDSHQSKEWEGTITLEELKQSSEELEISYEKFFDECKEALTRNGGVEHFQYLMENEKFTLTKSDEFQIQYLEIDMRPSYDLKHSLTLTAVDLIASLRNELSAVEQESKGLHEKYQTMVNTLKKCLDEKNLIEKKLLRKFAVLLNSKKDKIAELQDLLVEKNNKLEEAGISGIESNKRKSTEMLDSSIDNIDDFMQATQVMTQPVVTLPKRIKFNAADEVVAKRTNLARETASFSISTQEKESTNVMGEGGIEDSPDIFDQI